MSARSTILLALTQHFRREPLPLAAATRHLAEYDANITGRLRDFRAVWTASDGSDVPASELRCAVCGALVQGVPPKSLLDLNAMAASHECTPGGTA